MKPTVILFSRSSQHVQYNCRKRPRPCDEDCCELMPISKRINDLHIRSGFPESSPSLNE
ncbi:hypothetical protein CDAR_32721, partial [Caerostris darwini]